MGKAKPVFLALSIAFLLTVSLAHHGYAMDVTLGWDANTETDLAGYKIYYGAIQGGPYLGNGSPDGASPIIVPLSILANPSGPQCTVHGLTDGTYYFVVTAYDTEGLESGYSNEVYTQVSPMPPLPPPPSPNAAPVLSNLEVNGQSGSSMVQTNNRSVDIRIVASDDTMVSQYLILDSKSDPSGETFLTLPGGPRQNPVFTVSGFALNDTDGNHTIHAWVKDDKGLVSAAAAKTNVILDRLPAMAGFPVINYTESSITITYSENNIQNATMATSYSFDNGLILAGNGVDTSGTGKVYKLPLNPATLQHYFIYTMQISSAVMDTAGNAISPNSIRVNDDDNDGMADDWEKKWFGSITASSGSLDSDGDGLSDGSEYGYARNNPGWGSGRWALSPLSQDSDGDGIPDNYEVRYGLNPISASDKDKDLDKDGWTNYEEYAYGFLANDPSSHPQATIEVVEAIPLHNAGIPPDKSRIPNNTAIAVRLESTRGIDIGNPDAVLFSLSDGEKTYTRKMNDMNANGQSMVRPVPLDADGSVANSLWVSYYRTKETSMAGRYAFGATVEVTVQAMDVKGNLMEPVFFSFRVEDEQTSNQAKTKLPQVTVLEDKPEVGKKTVTVETGSLEGSAIIYDSAMLEELGFEPGFGPTDEVPLSPGGGAALNLQPPAVFPEPVTLHIPCPGYNDVSGLPIYYWDGQEWWLACDGAGNVTPEGEGWIVPGSRVNHNKDLKNQAYIEIQVYHFSAAAAGALEASEGYTGTGGTAVQSNSGGGSCFISTLWN